MRECGYTMTNYDLFGLCATANRDPDGIYSADIRESWLRLTMVGLVERGNDDEFACHICGDVDVVGRGGDWVIHCSSLKHTAYYDGFDEWASRLEITG